MRDSGRAFALNFRSPNLRRAQLAFGAMRAGEWAVMVTLGVVAFRDGRAAAVGLVAALRRALGAAAGGRRRDPGGGRRDRPAGARRDR